MSTTVIIAISVGYMALLFFIAYFVERKSAAGKSWVNNPFVYALSLGVYCTAWTFFGSVGKAASSGIDFLPIYLGPTIAATVWWFVLRKIILISKSQHITSIADFISSRYGKSTFLGVLVTIISIFSVIPYISIQLKAVAVSYDILSNQGAQKLMGNELLQVPFYLDTAWYIAIALAIFAILFGTRNLDPNERHEGLVAAVAFESFFKLIAFLSIGIFVTFGLFNGFADVFSNAYSNEDIAKILFLEEGQINAWSWFWLMLLSTFAIIFLPRQFHIAVVENTNPNFLRQATWIFPLYLLLINIFVLPIAVGGIVLLGTEGQADMFVLSIPMLNDAPNLALLVALGGFSASTSMVVVAVTALGIMVSNNILLPSILKSTNIQKTEPIDLPKKLIGIRRVSIVIILILAYGYFKFVSTKYPLVSIGLISFAGVAQFAPAFLGGIFWKNATRWGAIAGLSIGFLVWGFCLPIATLSDVGLLSQSIVENGLFGIELLKPYSLFGLESEDRIAHGAFWSLLFNTLAFVAVSLHTKQTPQEVTQADLFVDYYKYQEGSRDYEVIKRRAKLSDIRSLLSRFLGSKRAKNILKNYEKANQVNLRKTKIANEDLIKLVETNLSGAIGAASAKIILNSVVKEDPISLEEIFGVLEQTKEIIQYSKKLEQKSNELEATTQQLRQANEQLQELDRLKADFITTVTHELRTPITSIKAFSKILYDNPNLNPEQTTKYLNIIVGESERIARLVNQVLDLEKIQRLKENWTFAQLNLNKIIHDTCQSVEQIAANRAIQLEVILPEKPLLVKGVRDKMTQAILNLVSNALKFCHPEKGAVAVQLVKNKDKAILRVTDNGKGIAEQDKELIFEKFTQLTDRKLGKPKGSGLGLPITKQIIERHEGSLTVENNEKSGATFIIQLPLVA